MHADWSDFTDDLTGPEQADDFDRPAFLSLLRRYFDASQLSSDFDAMQEVL